MEIISQYTRSFVLLNKFDNESLETVSSDKKLVYEIKYKEAAIAIEELKKKLIAEKEASDLFGRQRDDGFKSLLQSVVQTFGGKYLYPTIEEQAAHLLYFVIKIIHSRMEINVSAPSCLYGFYNATNIFYEKTVRLK